MLLRLAVFALASVFITPQQVHWTVGTGSVAGARIATIQGDPAKAGVYVMRFEFPNGFEVKPHVHTEPENVTVLQGELLIGTGDVANPKLAHAMPAGSFFEISTGTKHWAFARGLTIIEVRAIGPRETTMVHAH